MPLTQDKLDQFLRGLLDPSLTAPQLATLFDLRLLDFAKLVNSDQVQAALSEITKAAELRNRALAAASIPKAIQATTATLTAYLTFQHLFPLASDPRFATEHRRFASNARKSAWLLARIAHPPPFPPLPPPPRPNNPRDFPPDPPPATGIPRSPAPNSPSPREGGRGRAPFRPRHTAQPAMQARPITLRRIVRPLTTPRAVRPEYSAGLQRRQAPATQTWLSALLLKSTGRAAISNSSLRLHMHPVLGSVLLAIGIVGSLVCTQLVYRRLSAVPSLAHHQYWRWTKAYMLGWIHMADLHLAPIMLVWTLFHLSALMGLAMLWWLWRG
jgi:hypothetical protein